MQFTLAECTAPSLGEQLLSMMLFLAPLVGLPLLLWLRRSPRNSRDVLGPSSALPAGCFRHLLDSMDPVLPLSALLLTQVVVTAVIHSTLVLKPEDVLVNLWWNHSFGPGWSWDGDATPVWGWISAAGLVSGCGVIHWLRTNTSAPDVLRVGNQR